MSESKTQKARFWMYHDDTPEGKIYEVDPLIVGDVQKELAKGGWVDTPAKLKETPAEYITKGRLDPQTEAILKMNDNGEKPGAIGKAIGLHYSKVASIIKKHR